MILTLMSGCEGAFAGARCRAIALSTNPASLPLGERGPVPEGSFRLSQPFIEGTSELACCVNAVYSSPPTDCSAVDCEALRARLSVAGLKGEYVDEPCGRQDDLFTPPGGVGQCSVYLEGDAIVGVRSSCLD